MKRCVLVVDDSATARLAVAQALRRRGFDVLAVGELEELDAALARVPADLMLLDVHMPDVFGTDLVPWLREHRRFDRPILLYSNRSTEELKELAAEYGADGYIRKSARIEEVAARVERFLASGDA
jgi:DNA-binding response OmpR family regulator